MASDTCGRVSVTMLWKTVSESRMVTPETTKRTLTLITDEGRRSVWGERGRQNQAGSNRDSGEPHQITSI